MSKLLIRLMSDIHLEFSSGVFDVPSTDNDKDTILVLAGDIGIAKCPSTFKEFIEDMSMQFKEVIYIMGNHEHYKGKFPTTKQKLLDTLADCPNVHVLEKETKVFDGVAFICATLWSSMDNFNPLTMEQARNGMNDYKSIRTGPFGAPWKRKLAPKDTVADHINAVHYIFEEIEKQKEAGNKIFVVTHHLPSFLSIHEDFKGDPMNGAYASSLEEKILDTEPEIWVHGHVHNSFDYTLGETHIYCNPRGYDPSELNSLFNVHFNIEL